MADRTCLWCGESIDGTHALRRYCSSKCRSAKKYAERDFAPCTGCGAPTGYPVSRAPESLKCRACRGIDGVAEHGTLRGYDLHRRSNEQPCDPCRESWNTKCREWSTAARDRGYVRPGRGPRRDFTCAECGISINGGGSAGSAADGIVLCKPHRYKKRERDERAKSKRRAARRKLDKARRGVPANPRWSFVQGVCAHCGEWFTRRGQASPYCSSSCRRKDSPSGAWITQSDRRAIYERDNWMCQLCGDPIDRNVGHLDDWAPTLDHIECRSWALIPDHSPNNLRTAHRWCNAIRGNETYHAGFFDLEECVA